MSRIELNFEAEDVNDEGWDRVIQALQNELENFEVTYGDGDWMSFSFND